MVKYALATNSWGIEEVKAIHRVIDDNITTMWDKVKQFEREFAKYINSKYAVMVNSGSSANLLMTAALFYKKDNPLKRGDEIIAPAVSWPTTYFPLHQYGLKIKFVDIDLMTLNYDLNALENAVTNNTKAIMAVNLLGNSNDFDQINKIINNRDIYLIEDNCESMGAEYKNKKTGTFGFMGTFSTFFSHHMSTMEGGLIVTDDEEIYHILLSIRAHGWTRNLPKKNKITKDKSDDKFDEFFRFVLPGYNVRPIEMEGAIGLEQLKKLPEFIVNRISNANYFKKVFKDTPWFYTQKEIGVSSWFGFSLILKEDVNVKRKQLTNYLLENDIDVRPIVAGDFTKNEVLKYFDYELHGEMNNAHYLDNNGFFIGNHQTEIHDKIDYLFTVIKDYL